MCMSYPVLETRCVYARVRVCVCVCKCFTVHSLNRWLITESCTIFILVQSYILYVLK